MYARYRIYSARNDYLGPIVIEISGSPDSNYNRSEAIRKAGFNDKTCFSVFIELMTNSVWNGKRF
jgi:hypothetical protein